MSDQTPFPPEIQPNTPRTFLNRVGTFLKKVWEWAKTHKDYSIPLASFILGAVVGKLI